MTLWRDASPLLLASDSPARRLLLVGAGIPVETERSGLDERALERAWTDAPGPAETARRLALAKARAVSARRPGRLVLGADQVLDFDGLAVAKADDPAAAIDALCRLAGRSHDLRAAAALVRDGAILCETASSARLTMRDLDRDAVGRYVAAAGPAATRSVGGYEIEGIGIHLFTAVSGDHATILGLPLLPLLAALRDLGRLGI